MNEYTAEVLEVFIFFGWMLILAIGKAISWCIANKTCNKCTCKNCMKEKEE